MHRWWTKKGTTATVEELKKALDFINMAYIHEEYFDNMRKNLTSYTGNHIWKQGNINYDFHP